MNEKPLDYASRLSEYKNKGICGLPETIESSRSLQVKLNRLYELMIDSKHIVFLTGAGISTSAGIPDFRGPKGVWTMEEKAKRKLKSKSRKQKKKSTLDKEVTSADSDNFLLSTPEQNDGINLPDNKKDINLVEQKIHQCTDATEAQGLIHKRQRTETSEETSMSFENAQPTYTHLAVTQLIRKGIAHFCITQNVDGLHRRSGLDLSKLAILHGCIFTEKCEACHRDYFRSYDVGTISFQRTGRRCTICKGFLRDTLLDWEDELPEHDFQLATNHCSQTGTLVICLGTSLRIEPAGSLPELAPNGYVIVNMQVTPKDGGAKLVIRAKVDDVMNYLIRRFGIDHEEKT